MRFAKDQRQVERHIPKNTLLAVAAWPWSEVGIVHDIGLGGFSLECVDGDFRPGQQITFDFFISGHPEHFLLNGVSCRVVYDIFKQNSLSLDILSPFKVFGFCFVKITKEQESKLRLLLEQQTLTLRQDPSPLKKAEANLH